MTPDPGGFLTALRLADSFLPVGGYTASYGIEQYLNEDRITEIEELGATLEAYLVRIVGPCETVAVSNAHAACEVGDTDRLLAVDERLHAVTMPREFRRSATAAGGQLCRLLLDDAAPTNETSRVEGEMAADSAAVASSYAVRVDDGTTPGHYPVVFGVVAQRERVSKQEACLAHAYSFVTGVLGAAQRLGRFGHTEIQRLLGALQPVIADVCDRYVDEPASTMASFAPMAEIMGMRHERAERRLFTS